ncbi:hypothetical protein ONE63_001631 [Megalurothrips usitatus]|uniref:THAP-type domain-containing protein n=1 Tax=Megalurothrips usitatus TaxID=439358 RepID=A0AAV7X8Z0_9NEOP|nr:hypothetical protein ONE63_001631 [Megalurothrips usitatus]
MENVEPLSVKVKKDRHNCCVPQCSAVKTEGNHLHQVPKDEALLRKWKIAIKTGKPLHPKMTVCSKHFLDSDYIISQGTGKLRRLKPGSVPSQHLPQRVHDKVLSSPLKRKHTERAARASKRTARMRDVGIQVSDEEVSFVSNLLTSDRRLVSATGIHSIRLLNVLTQCADEIASESPLKKFSLGTRDRIILTMMKIKLNVSFCALAAIFDLSNSQTCANYFYDTVIILSKVLKSMITWADKEDILKNMPKCFNNYKSTRAILDGYEVTVEKPKCIKCRIRLYSQYKKNFTAKVMMVCAPSGLITLCAASFGGRASDKVVTKHTGVYNLCDLGDALMVDKGFNIDDECKENFIKLIRPPFQRNKKYSKSESVECAKIARARVHVERVIQRVREFALLRGKIPWIICPYIDSLVIIASGLVNLGHPIMATDKY